MPLLFLLLFSWGRDANDFGTPGVYLFNVWREPSGSSSEDEEKWSYETQGYRLRVYVVNDGKGGLEYSGITIHPIVYDSEENREEELADKVDTLSFAYAYIGWQTLTVSKSVKGDFGNKAYDFPFEITLYLPEWYDTSQFITIHYFDECNPEKRSRAIWRKSPTGLRVASITSEGANGEEVVSID